VANPFLYPSDTAHLAEDDKGRLSVLDACAPVAGSYLVSTGSMTAELCDFVLPAWSDKDAGEADLIDYLGRLSNPFSVNKGAK
jgi:hypothetical protein